MNKARDNTPTAGRSITQGRYRVRDMGETGSPASSGPETRKPQRFVEPYRLNHEQRRAMLAPLERLGVGDDETRLLFAAALEYDLASCRDALEQATDVDGEPEQPSSTKDHDLTAIHQAARELAKQLKSLDEQPKARLQQALKETDRFRRTYDDEYFGVLRYELLRLAAVSAPPLRPEPPAKPAVSDAAQRFIIRAANAFEECFDTRATARVDGPFLPTLKAIATTTGIRIPTDARPLAKLLKTT